MGKRSSFMQADAVVLSQPQAENTALKKPKRTVDELIEGLPVEKIILDLTGEEQVCGTCGSKLKRIGEKLVRREIETTRKQVRLLEYYTVTYACPGCEKETGYAHIFEHKAPPPLLKHSLASPSAVPADTAAVDRPERNSCRRNGGPGP